MQSSVLGRDFDVTAYNALIPVEAADREVRRDSRLDAFLKAAQAIFVAHGMETRFGVALLHKHGPCADGEHMIEYREVCRDNDALITRPTTNTPQQDGAVPTVWAIADGAFVPLEYSTDAVACELFHGDVPAQFLADFTALCDASPIGKLVGLAVVNRGFYDAAGPDQIALEYSSLIERSNVVFLSDRAVADGKSIETAWRFQTVIDGILGCTDTRNCIKICHAGSNGHSGEVAHTPDNGPHL